MNAVVLVISGGLWVSPVVSSEIQGHVPNGSGGPIDHKVQDKGEAVESIADGVYAISGKIGDIKEVGLRSRYDSPGIVVPVYEFAVTLSDIVVEIGEAEYFPDRKTFSMLLSHMESISGGDLLVLLVEVKNAELKVRGWDVPRLFGCIDKEFMDDRYRITSDYISYTVDNGLPHLPEVKDTRCFEVSRRYRDWRNGKELWGDKYERKLEDLREQDAKTETGLDK